MVKLAQSRSDKVNAWQSGFDQFTETNTDVFDGIWASSSLLHADRVDMPSHLTAIRSALTKDGIFFIGVCSWRETQLDSFSLLWIDRSFADESMHVCEIDDECHVCHVCVGWMYCWKMKLGEGAQRDTIGRMYTFYQPDELAALLMQVGFNVDDEKTTTGTSVGLDGVKHGWVKMFAKKN